MTHIASSVAIGLSFNGNEMVAQGVDEYIEETNGAQDYFTSVLDKSVGIVTVRSRPLRPDAGCDISGRTFLGFPRALYASVCVYLFSLRTHCTVLVISHERCGSTSPFTRLHSRVCSL